MREKLILFSYEIKNALVGMGRHWILCLSSIITITLTLILIASFALIGTHVDRFSRGMASELTIHAIITSAATEPEQYEYAQNVLENMDNVRQVVFSSKEQELEAMIAQKGEAFAMYRGEDNPLNNAYFIYVEDESRIAQTAQAIEDLDFVDEAAYGGSSVQSLVRILTTIRYVSFGLALLMMILSLYLIYNTIKTTIYSRSTEIGIMKTVGASDSFIRIPFEIEGILLGTLGAVLPYVMIVTGYPALYDRFQGRIFLSEFSLQPVDQVKWQYALLLFGVGIVSGWLASRMAATKYVKKIR